MMYFIFHIIKQIVKALCYGTIGGIIVVLVFFVMHLESRPGLKVWHEAELDAEFTEDSDIDSLDGYLALEEQLFVQLNERVYDRIESGDRRQANRFYKGSLADPGRWSTNWNRTFVLDVELPQAGVLLLHGMSDSPYSLLNLGKRLHEEGAWVVGLRLPGHGTAPAAMMDMEWEDMAAAVRLAMLHLRDKVGNRPLYIVGYSNGGALAVHYALASLDETVLPSVNGLVLISPALGVTPLAAFAVWQARLGHLFGLDKLAWNSIQPEYDPFKYISFAVNGGDQVYRLTAAIRSRFKRLDASGGLERFPKVLAFQSVVDATVSTGALIDDLFKRLPPGGHELVLFDVNRTSEVVTLFKDDPRIYIDKLLHDEGLSFTLSLVTNKNEDSREVVVRHNKQGDPIIVEDGLDMNWPDGLYSLSHVALPFPMSDPLYGSQDSEDNPGIQLGDIALRGERNVFQISAADMLRLRWNPFYPYLEERLLEFVQLPEK
jgi:pimeloyl-ACP methyl ester carboxylesterase